MITLYGSKRSGSVATEAALELAGVGCEKLDADEQDPGYEALKRVNPLGQVPTLVHDDGSVFADQFPATPWLSGEQLGALDILASTVSTPVKSVRARHWPAA